MARKALIAVLAYETSITNLSPEKKVVNTIFKQLQNNYLFNNSFVQADRVLGSKIAPTRHHNRQNRKGKISKSLRAGSSYENQTIPCLVAKI